MAKSSAEIAIELRAKFEFYLLALVFSILGLSIQTAEFGTYLTADAFELAGWMLLFASGVIGILRGEWIPVAYDIQSKIGGVKERLDVIRTARQRGADQPMSFSDVGTLSGVQAEKKLSDVESTLYKQHQAVENRIIRRYGWMRWTFLLGVGCLLVGRALPHVLTFVTRAREQFAAVF